MMRVMIAGGGTAGHTNPGIAVAESLVKMGLSPDEIGFVGSTRGNEATLVPAAGFHLDVLAGRGIPRSFSVAAVRSVGELLRGGLSAIPLLRRRRPEVVLCLGGFAAFAPSVAALLLRIPVVVTEQNARASLVNRIIGRFAAASAIPFPPTQLPRAVLCGNPTRHEVTSLLADHSSERRAAARQRFGVRDDATVLIGIWAGSLGADSVNRAARELASTWRHRSSISIHHVVGRRNPGALAPLEGDGGLVYRTVPYENDMPELLLAADLAVTRGGASTVAELSIANLPAVIVPLPKAPRDHQRANAMEVVSAGKGVIIDDDDLSGAVLAEALEPLLHATARTAMRNATPSVDHSRAADEVAKLVLVHLRVGGQ
ncbi:MAG: UDP-N-acetylglucosamine--N-acetylmuramyl-(pentapeptide) pyrophosphoryl-undecaprenol N-acetylglucosamine transferase [Acidimicrobiales bacterium]|nr:UDP-N-acetylglucosamine--N-acetylmuramyl-(pentapeptide) pyrophosphoryl-undecaprenol N-acetylglucosamine transferase [Acidimicrobiales bacterium]